MKTKIVWVPGFAVLLLWCPSAVRAQLTAEINGTVKDASGAIVPKAKVTLVNAETGVRRQRTSNSEGYYAFPILQPATYQITAETPGFKPVRYENVKLDVAQTIKIDFALSVGDSSQSVEVRAAAELLDVGVSAIGQVVGEKSVANLPTNGRNSYSFITLVPGVRAPAGFQAAQITNVSSAFVSINGARPNQSAFYLDGGTNSQSNFNGPTYTPSLDIVQEFKVQTNNFSAEYTNTAGGVVNLITKSGTNAFHGTVYEFLRNDKFDANSFFLNRAGLKKAEYRFNQFGGTVGGPIIRNKTFFFFGYEGLRLVQGVTLTNTLPTADQRAGDFSNTRTAAGQLITIYDPVSTRADPANPGRFIRTAFLGNKIPAARFDRVAANLLKYIPLPNTAGSAVTAANNFASNASAPTNKDDLSMRIDHQVNDKLNVFGRISHNHTLLNTPDVYGGGDPGGPQIGTTDFTRYAGVINGTYIFRPNLLMELSSGFNRWAQRRNGTGVGFDPTTLGLPASIAAHSAVLSFPTITITGMQGTASDGNVYGAGILAGGGTQLAINGYDRFEERANLTWMRGRHTLKLGALFGVPRQGNLTANGLGGTYNFSQGMTQGPDPLRASATAGFGFASFLLGTAASGNHPTSQVGMNVINKYVGGYVQDDFKLTPRLTFNVGIRYDYTTPFTERYNHLDNFNAGATTNIGGVALRGGLQFPGVGGTSRYAWQPIGTNVAPRVGFAYNLGKSTVLRGGYGIFFAQMSGGSFNNNAIPNTGFNCITSMIATSDGGLTPRSFLSNPFSTGFCNAPGNSQGLLTNLGQAVFATDRNSHTPYSQQWNFDIQRSLPGSILVEAGYSGNHGSRLLGDLEWNQIPLAAMSLGTDLLRTVPNPYAGIVTSGPLSLPTVTLNQLLRPYLQFLYVTATASTYGSSIYHALQAKAERRFSKGISFLAAYTWSKLIDDVDASTVGFPGGSFSAGGLQNYNNRRNERALATFDTPHNFALSSVWEIPVGKGKAMLNRSGWLDKIAGGWQINGILSLQSGTPLQIVGGNASGAFGGTQRPNWSGVDATLTGNISDRLNRYFSTSVFTQNDPFTFGNAPRVIPNLRAPGVRNVSASLFKNFEIHESIRLQLRGEFFNLFNTPQFGLPNGNINATNFGVISSQVNTPRDIQLALKLLF